MSLRLSPRALRGISSVVLIATLFTGFSGSPAASAATYGSASFRGDAMLIGSNMPAANSSDFTYEFYFKMNSLPSLAGVNTVGGGIWLFTTRPNRWNPGGITLFVHTNGSLQLDASDSAAKTITSITSPSATVAINNWYHLAITRSANIFKVWVNGTQVSTGSALSTASGFSGNYNSTQLGFGEYLPGNITNFRFTTGTALYTSTFSPATTQLTANGTTQVLIPFESDYTTISSYSTIPSLTQPTGIAAGSAYFGGTGYQDATGNLNSGSYLTNNGVTFSPTNPYGEKSICFGGNQARYFDYPSGEKIGTSSFTLEMWVKPKSWSNYMTFLNTGYGAGNGSYLGYNVNTGPRAIIFYNAEQLGSTGPGVPLDTWSHVAIVRDQVAMKIYMYINGSKVSEGNSASYDFSNPRLSIGNDFNGCMTSVRLAKSALYTSNFTPTALGAFSSVPGGTNVMVTLSARGVSTLNTGTAGLMQGTGTITFEDLPKLSQTITFASLGNKTIGMSAFALSASSTSGQSVSFTSATSEKCTVSGSTVTLVATGTCTINADQAGNVDYDAANQVQRSFSILATQPTLVVSSASGTYGSTTTLTTSGGSGNGPVSYDVVSGNCSVAGDVLSSTSAGNCVVTATKASDATYGAITSAQSTVVIGKKSEIFSYSISSSTGSFKYGALYTVTMTFPLGAVAGNNGWNVLKASTAWGINGVGDQMCTGATVSAAGAYTCSFNSASMWPNAQAMAISGLHVRFNGSTNFNSFDQDTSGTKISIAGCDYVFCPSTESVTVTATNKSISYGANLDGVGFETPYGDTGGQLRYTISNGANGATKAWGVSCTSTYTTGAAVGTYPITCSGTTRPTGAPNPVTDEWVIANTNYSSLYNANVDNFLYTLKNPRSYTSAANWWKRGSFYASDTYQYLSYVQGTLTVNPLTLTAPTSVSAAAVVNNSTSIRISFIQSAYATSHTALVYASNGTTLLRTIPSYESGTAVTGLDPNTAYKVSVKAIGDGSNSADSAPSTQASVTTNINYNRTLSYAGGVGALGTLPNAEVKLTNETVTVGLDSGISKNGYSFAHWSNGVNSFAPGGTYTFGALDETLTAQWTINSYAITFDATGGSGGTTASVNYNVDALASAPTVTKSQYIFAGWAETITATSINSWTVVGSKTLYSLWTPKVYTITYLPESGTATTSSETFTVGTSPIALQSATRSGYKFNGWFTSKTSGTLIGTTGAQFTPTDTATVHAQWIQASLVGLSSPTSFGTIVATSGNDGGISATRSGTKAEIDYFADSLPDGTIITAYLQGSTVYAASQLTGVSNLLLSVVVAWKALDESVPLVDPTKSAIRLKITNPDIKRGAKVYSIVGDTSTVITTAAQDGFVVIDLREDPEIVIANPVVVPAQNIVAPIPSPIVVVVTPAPDPAIAEAALKAKQEAEAKSAAELKAAQEKAAAELTAARLKAEQELKDALTKADEAARLKAETDAKAAAELKAMEDAALAAALAQKKIVPNVTLYSISPSLKLSTYDRAYLSKYVSTLKAKSTVTCIGYVYAKNVTASVAKSRASKQATAICAMIKSQKKTITTKVLLYPSWKAPKAAAGAKWVAVSYRVDGFKS